MKEPIVLRCVTYRRSANNIFRVWIRKDDEVSDLKEVIKEKKQNDFANIDADRLTLWRVSVPVDDNADAALAGLVLENSKERGIKELRPIDRISVIFPGNLAENHVHVIVQPPATG